mgnify:CR=1 FL=1
MDAAHFEKTLTSEVLFEGRVVTLTKDTALLENGKTATREVVHHHGSRSCGSCPPASWKKGRTPLKPPSGSWRRSAA